MQSIQPPLFVCSFLSFRCVASSALTGTPRLFRCAAFRVWFSVRTLGVRWWGPQTYLGLAHIGGSWQDVPHYLLFPSHAELNHWYCTHVKGSELTLSYCKNSYCTVRARVKFNLGLVCAQEISVYDHMELKWKTLLHANISRLRCFPVIYQS